MKNWTVGLLVLAVMCAASASTKSAGNLSRCNGKPLFIDSMQENFGEYITTEIMAQSLNLSITTEASRAACVMRGTVALGGFRNTGSASIKMIGPEGDVVWSATSGDKDSVKDLAHNLVKQLKRDLRDPATTK